MASNNADNKCPACGTHRTAMEAVCSSCGYTYTKSNAKVVEELSNLINGLCANSLFSIGYQKKLIEAIRSFHIPHIKDEILDVMFFVQPKALEKASPISLAWRSRQREVFERAKAVCVGDKTNLNIISRYEAELDKVANRKFLNWWYLTPWYIKTLIIIVLLFLLILIIPAKDVSPEAYAVRFHEAVATEKLDKAISYLSDCPEMGLLIADDYATLIEGLVRNNRMIEAESLANKQNMFIPATGHTETKSRIAKAFIDKYIAEGNIEKAEQFIDTTNINSLVTILKSYIESNNEEGAMRFYRKHSTRFVKYDFNQHRRMLQTDDEVVISFLNDHGIKI